MTHRQLALGCQDCPGPFGAGATLLRVISIPASAFLHEGRGGNYKTMIRSIALYISLVASGPNDHDWAVILHNGVRFEAVGRIDWTRRPDHYWRFDWDFNLPANRQSYEKAREKQAKTPLPYGVA